jgi:thioredoxin reductase
VVVSPRFRANTDFLAPLGLESEGFEMRGEALGTLLRAEPTGATAVPGVWVAGNAGEPMAQVVASAAAGLRAGAMVNADLVEEEALAAVTTHLADRTPPGGAAGHPGDVRGVAGHS